MSKSAEPKKPKKPMGPILSRWVKAVNNLNKTNKDAYCIPKRGSTNYKNIMDGIKKELVNIEASTKVLENKLENKISKKKNIPLYQLLGMSKFKYDTILNTPELSPSETINQLVLGREPPVDKVINELLAVPDEKTDIIIDPNLSLEDTINAALEQKASFPINQEIKAAMPKVLDIVISNDIPIEKVIEAIEESLPDDMPIQEREDNLAKIESIIEIKQENPNIPNDVIIEAVDNVDLIVPESKTYENFTEMTKQLNESQKQYMIEKFFRTVRLVRELGHPEEKITGWKMLNDPAIRMDLLETFDESDPELAKIIRILYPE